MICRKALGLFLYRILDNKMNTWSIPKNLINKKFLSPKELKEILGVSLPTIYRLIDSRKIPVYKIRNSLRFLNKDIIEYLESKRIDPII